MGVMLTTAYQVDGADQELAVEIINQAHGMIQGKFEPSLLSDYQALDQLVHKQSILFRDAMTAVLYYRLLQEAIYPIQINGGLGLSEDIAQSLTFSDAALSQASDLGPGYVLYNANFMEDNLLNMHLINWQRTVQDQNPVARVVAFLYEIQAPLWIKGAMVAEDFLGDDLMAINAVKQVLYAKEEKLLSMTDITFSARKPTKWVDIFQELDSKKFYVTGLFKRGYATAIADMTYMTRQNIDYHFKSGRFAFERDMFATIVLQMDREQAALGG
ncbi:hypothetical protein EF384_05255 [Aerococcus agrisoli]|uniref:Uncharacterized protein n=1 Tax=Aerococcus agrisoli TaxID=2487350 RepID=A0A3N4GCT1_9LACT|nr:hypothetical protein [Aerococcus agrisoli]RPA60572.1 hypothetical protein EF384_05255 [Aerococcus agrisoli]